MKIAIFGTGAGGKNAFKLLSTIKGMNIAFFFDNNSELWGEELFDIPILSPSNELISTVDKIIIASQYRDEISRQLSSLGIKQECIEIAHSGIMNGRNINFDIFSGYQPNVTESYVPYQTYREDVFHTLSKTVEISIAMGIEGDIVEFGCGSGQSSFILAKSILENSKYYEHNKGEQKKLWLFDSFEGLPESYDTIDKESPNVINNIWGKAACADITEEQLSKLLIEELSFEHFIIQKGWFDKTLINIPHSSKFSVVHLDCDLYLSTYVVLDYLLTNDHIANGCILLFDDWSANGNQNNFGQQKAWADITKKFNLSYESRGYYGLGSAQIALYIGS